MVYPVKKYGWEDVMPELKPFEKLIAFIATLILAALGIFSIIQIGVMEMIFGEAVANQYIYPVIGTIIQWVAVVAIVTIVVVGIATIVRYMRNRNKPKEDSEIAKVVKNATDTIVSTIKEELQKLTVESNSDKTDTRQ